MAHLVRARLLIGSAIALILVADVAALATRDDNGTATQAAAPTTSTTAALPPSPVVLIGRATPDQSETPTVLAVRADGAGLTPSPHPAVRTDQVWGRRKVWSKILDQQGSHYSGCGIAGCSSGYRSSTEAGIAAAQFDGVGERQLTKGGYDTAPSYGPDGTIAFLRHHRVGDGYEVTNSVALMDARGRITDALTPPAGYSYQSFAWSPDGKSIAVHRVSTNTPADVEGASGIFILGIEPRSERLLAVGNFRELAWSHDGTRLAAIRMAYVQYGTRTQYQPGDHHRGDDLWVVPLDGSAPRQVTQFAPKGFAPGALFCRGSGSAFSQLKQPMWSPDDTQIAFLSNNNHLVRFGRTYDVAVAKADGSGVSIAYAVPADACVPVDQLNSHAQAVEIATLYGWATANVSR